MTKTYIKILFTVLALLVAGSAFAGTPQNIRVTNIHGTSFTVSWTSPNNERGQVKYGTDTALHANWQTANDDRGADVQDDIHYVTVSGLAQNTLYYFEIISGSTTNNNYGQYYSVNPGPYAVPSPGTCSPAGQIYKDLSNTQFAYDSIVYITILGTNGGENSATESVLYTSQLNGYWNIDLVNFRNISNTDFYSFSCETNSIFIEVEAGNDGSTQVTNVARDFSDSGETASITVIAQASTGSGGGGGGSGCFINSLDNKQNDNFSIALLIVILMVLLVSDIYKKN